jgi:plasmid maintenance system antidote protein VapI
MPKFFKDMGRRMKPDVIIQSVYDEYRMRKEKKKDKDRKKLLSYSSDSAKYLKSHDRREKRRTAMGMLGGLFSGIGSIFGSLGSMIGGLFGGMGGGIGGFFTKLLLNPLFWTATGIGAAAFGGQTVWNWFDKKFGDADGITGTIWRSFKNAFPGMELGKSIREGITGGISRLWAGEDFDIGRVVKESLTGFLDKKFGQFGVGFGDWWKVVTGKATDKEKKDISEKMMKRMHGENVEALEIKARRAAEAKGFKEKVKTKWDLFKSSLKSSIGMDVEEDKMAITRLRAQKLMEKYGGLAEDYMGLTLEQGEALGKKILAISKEKAQKAGELVTSTTRITMDKAKELSDKYGGKPEEYLNMTVEQAKKYGSKIKEKYDQASKKASELATSATTITMDKAKEYSDKYGGKPEEYLNMTVEQAKKYGSVIKEKYDALAQSAKNQAAILHKEYQERAPGAKGKILTTWTDAKNLAKRYGGDIGDYVGKTWGEARDWGELQKQKLSDPQGWAKRQKYEAERDRLDMMMRVERVMHKTQDYLEIGKDTFVPIYQTGKSTTKEFLDTVAPEKKAMIRRQLESALASGEITVNELKKMGIKLKDATLEGASKVGNTVAQTAVYTSNQVTNAVNNVSGGGGNGNASKFVQEKTMDEIARGDVLF